MWMNVNSTTVGASTLVSTPWEATSAAAKKASSSVTTSTHASTALWVSVQHTQTQPMHVTAPSTGYWGGHISLKCIKDLQGVTFLIVHCQSWVYSCKCLYLLVCANSIKPYATNSTTVSYKSKIDGTMRGDILKLASISQLLSRAATRCGKRMSVSQRTK